MNYRPVCDTWILGRPKVKYHGAFPAGFLERARYQLVGWRPDLSILHVCAGRVRDYNGSGGMPLTGFFENDITMDLDPDTEPDAYCDVRRFGEAKFANIIGHSANLITMPIGYKSSERVEFSRPDSILIDLPYTREDHMYYNVDPEAYPGDHLNEILVNALNIVKPGGIVGVLDYRWPAPKPHDQYKEIFVITVTCGRGNRGRLFTGWIKK